jgi:predicted enzyme related to lactoylglutathione lyase
MGDDVPPEVPTYWATYFAVADLAESVQRCMTAGGSVVAPAFDTPVGQMAVLQDPAGAVFSIGQFVAIDDPNDWPTDR